MSIGYHCDKTDRKGKKCEYSKSLKEFVDDMNGYGFHDLCAQIFVSGPQTLNKPTVSESDYSNIRELTRNGLKLVAHSAYVSAPFNRSPGAIHNIKQELKICDEIGALGLIIHTSAACYDVDNIKYVLEKISEVDLSSPKTIWFEMHTAKRSDFTYETPEKIKALFEKINSIKINNDKLSFGFAIDSAHAYACGQSFADYNITWNWLNSLPDVPLLLHLNDSASELSSGKDRHAALTKGNIWSNYRPSSGKLDISDSGLLALLEFATEKSLITILERDSDGIENDLFLISSLNFFQ